MNAIASSKPLDSKVSMSNCVLAGDDYDVVDAMVSFPAGHMTGQECTTISIRDNFAFERDEDFLIHVASEPGIIIYEPYSRIRIRDDDSKLMLRVYNHYRS